MQESELFKNAIITEENNESKENWSLEPIKLENLETTLDIMMSIQQKAHPQGLQETKESFNERITQDPKGAFLIKNDKEENVGYIFGHPGKYSSFNQETQDKENFEDKENYYIHDLALIPDEQKKQIGQKVYKKFEQDAIERGFKNIFIVSVSETEKFWEKQGFVAVETIEDYSGHGDPGIKMKKILNIKQQTQTS